MADVEDTADRTGSEGDALFADRVEVRLLGAMSVRRAGGDFVLPREWRTGKTADLLRLLALSNGEVVPVSTLVDALWPDGESKKARASLRTAMCHLRKVLGAERIERRDNGLRLVGAWVDATAFVELTKEAGRHRRHGRGARAVRAAREADALYVGDFRAHDDDVSWAGEWREQLLHDHLGALTDGAEAAVELGWMRDAVDFATRVVERSYCSERAYRVLIEAYAGLGETDRALTTYEQCRSVLAEELGADPSPQTQALHVQVLRAAPVPVRDAPWCGREPEVQWLADALQAAAASGHCALVRVSGPEGSGRHRLVDEASARTGVRVMALSGQDVVPDLAGIQPVVVVVPEPPVSKLSEFGALVRELVWTTAIAVVVIAADEPGAALPDDLAATVLSLEVSPLTPDEIASLAETMLGGSVTPQLADELATAATGNLGRAIATLRDWTVKGRVTATAGGLALALSDLTAAADDLAPVLPRLVEQLEPGELDVLGAVALLDAPVSPIALTGLLYGADAVASVRDGVQRTVDHLVDLAVVETSEQGVSLRDPMLRSAVESWLRPAVRRRLHLRIADQPHVALADRVRHWVAAGESERAGTAALAAADEAAASCRWVDVHDHLQLVLRLLGPDASADERCDIQQRLGDCALALGRRHEARDAYLAAEIIARDNDLPGLVRILGKVDASAHPVVLPQQRIAPEAPVKVPVRPTRPVEPPARDWAAALLEVETELLPRRAFEEARDITTGALAASPDPFVRARAVLLRRLPDVVLGSPTEAVPALVAASVEAVAVGADDLARALDAARRLGEHDLGVAGRSDTAPGADDVDDWTWTDLRLLTEQGDTAGASLLEPLLPLPADRPLTRHLGLLAAAELRLATGELQAAVDILEALLDEALRDGPSLLVPLVAARLVCLVAPTDLSAAREYLDLMDLIVGASGDMLRERIWRHLARAAIRAGSSHYREAAASCAIASRIATEAGVLPLAARAELRRTTYLREAGAYAESRLAAAEASRLRQQCGLAVIDDPVVEAEEPKTFGRAKLRMA